jgi:regulator of CtrA degradation
MQRAVSAGELTREAAQTEKHRINLAEIGAGYELKGAEQMPEGLKALIRRSLRLHERIVTLDAMISEAGAGPAGTHNPVARQMNRLAEVFARSKSEAG